MRPGWNSARFSLTTEVIDPYNSGDRRAFIP
jgi:hypothetical protein